MPRVSNPNMDALIQKHMRFEDEPARRRFCAYVRQGIEPFLAAIHATGDMPGVVGTDTQYMAGSEKQFDKCPKIGQLARKKKPGYTPGAKYHDQLGRWVHSQGDVVRWAKKLGRNVETPDGKFLYKAPEVPPPPSKLLSEKTIRDHFIKAHLKNPGAIDTPAKRKKFREDIINKHAPSYRK